MDLQFLATYYSIDLVSIHFYSQEDAKKSLQVTQISNWQKR